MAAKKYSVRADNWQQHQFDNLVDAKKFGEKVARKNSWKGRYNNAVQYVSIIFNISPGYGIEMYYMPYPVTGTGRTRDQILELMQNHGEPPYKWIRNELFEHNCKRFKEEAKELKKKFMRRNP